jgi:hypothetical protein
MDKEGKRRIGRKGGRGREGIRKRRQGVEGSKDLDEIFNLLL